jgi:putative ABC transport system permease protein
MMLFKLSAKNIAKSIKDYAIYFFTLILGVAIFYVFNAIDSQTVMLDVSKNTSDIIKLMTGMLSGVSVFVSIILGCLIIFLIKRRNKEFGVYLTLGMGKRKISLVLFFETLIIGIISLIVGLIIGTAFSQLMSIVVANMFEADMRKFEFVFSRSACIKTLIYFGIMYAFVMVFNTWTIGKCKLIDLLNGRKRNEKIKNKNSIVCIMVFIISWVVLGRAYYLVTVGVNELESEMDILIPIMLGIVGTLLFFWSVSGLILKIVMAKKSTYYKGLNSFVLRQISSKINTTVVQMTIICIMLFVTICVLSSAFSIKNSLSENIQKMCPADIQITVGKEVKNDVINNKQVKVKSILESAGCKIEDEFSEYVEYDTYKTQKLTLRDVVGNSYNEIAKTYKGITLNSQEDIMKISDYNKVAKLYGQKTFELKENQYLVVANFQGMVQLRNIALKNGEKIKLGGKEYSPLYRECKYGFVNLSGNEENSGIIVLPDSALKNAEVYDSTLVGKYNTAPKDEIIKNNDRITKIMGKKAYNMISINTKMDVAEACIGLGAIVTFIGMYLGIIFLISSAAILALKELSESTDNKERYLMLRKLGTDDKMINRALFKQIGIYFMFPLIIAIIHSVVGLKFATTILATFGKVGLLGSIILTAVVLVLIYGGYFLITYFCSRNIIKER